MEWKVPEAPLSQQLALLNRGHLQESLAVPGNQVDAIMDFELTPERQVEALFRRLLSRSPSDEERATFLTELNDAKDARAAARDLAFALLVSREFGSQR